MDSAVAAAFLKEKAASQQVAIARYQTPSGAVWLRKALAHHSLWIYTPLRWLARFLRVRALQPVPNPGGAIAVDREAKRLRELASAGIAVPVLLAKQDDALLMTDVSMEGKSKQLEHVLKQSVDSASLLTFFTQAVTAISHAHLADQYLSQAFARNIMLTNDGNIAFIDFEDDPGEVMALPLCQARDWLCFIFSTAVILEHQNQLDGGVVTLVNAISQENYAAQKALLKVCRRLSWIRFLPIASLGSDGKRVVAAGQCLAALEVNLSVGTRL
ncbi:MAG: serine/threonine protein kinase [Moraxellaceae bacterium]|nr:serine/threonine protein kinase [Moraxellaceae bacterium]MDZ4385617.1 serine/threonine protein kinase [Moraxellaceae bacterium]